MAISRRGDLPKASPSTAIAASQALVATPGGAGIDKGVGGWPLPAMTVSDRYAFDCTFAQVSRNPTVRLNTGRPGWESGSNAK